MRCWLLKQKKTVDSCEQPLTFDLHSAVVLCSVRAVHAFITPRHILDGHRGHAPNMWAPSCSWSEALWWRKTRHHHLDVTVMFNQGTVWSWCYFPVGTSLTFGFTFCLSACFPPVLVSDGFTWFSSPLLCIQCVCFTLETSVKRSSPFLEFCPCDSGSLFSWTWSWPLPAPTSCKPLVL